MDPRNDAVFRDDDLEDDEESLDEDDDEEEEEELLNSASPSTSTAAAAATVTVAAVPTAVAAVVKDRPISVIPAPSITSISSSDLIRQRLETAVAEPLTEKKPLDESRKLFQRLWTDEDEIELLQGFLDYTMHRGSTHHHQNDTALFYDQIKSKLQLDFNKNQLVEKLRRLKKKYRTVVGKITSGKEFNFKSPHDHATFEISRKIWSNTGGRIGVDDNALDDDEPPHHPNLYVNYIDTRNEELMGNCVEKKPVIATPKSRKRSRPGSGLRIDGHGVGVGVAARVSNENSNKEKISVCNNENVNNNNNNNNNSNNNVAGLIEETVRSCMSPLFKELLNSSMGGLCGGRGFSGLALHPIPLSFTSGGEMTDERWRKQQILELEVYSKRLELVQEQIKTALEDLRSMGG